MLAVATLWRLGVAVSLVCSALTLLAQPQNQAIDPATGYACRAAYDLSKETGFADTDPISTLSDQSDKGKHLTATLSTRPLFQANEINGYGVAQFDGINDALIAATAADWKFLHDGHGFTIIALVRQRDADPNRLDSLVDTLPGFASASQGMAFFLDDRASIPRNNGVAMAMSKGVGGRPVLSVVGTEALRPLTWQIVVARYNAGANSPVQFSSDVADLAFEVDGLAVGGANAANLPHGTGNPTGTMTVGANVAASLWAKVDLAGLWIFDVALPSDLMDAYIRWITLRFDVGYTRDVESRVGYNGFGTMVRLADGIILGSYAQADRHDGGGLTRHAVQRRSSNLGWDWGLPESISSDLTKTAGAGVALITSTGTVLYSGMTDNGGSGIDAFSLRSTDGGLTRSSAITPTHGFTQWSATGVHPMVELSNGHVLWAVYGLNTSGTFTATKTVLSTDDGASWGSPVTIADGPGNSTNWNETAIVKISGTYPTETLLALIRNDTNNRIDKATSLDSGASWGATTSAITGIGGDPILLKASSGNLIFVGRQRTAPARAIVRFSTDSGANWSATDYNVDAINGFNNYSSILETSPGKFLIMTSSEFGAQSANPTMSKLRSKHHKESEILLFP